MRNIIIIAPPAAGKSTVSDYLVKNYNYEHISTGDLLRDEIRSGSNLGQEIDKVMSSGNLVNDELIIKLVSDKLNNLDKTRPFILDGIPRSINQAHKLDYILVSLGFNDILVIYLNIDIVNAMDRVLNRIICSNCGKSYNLKTLGFMPKQENKCDDCGMELVKRSDDNEDAFKVRFQSYLDNISPILDYYKKKQLLNVDVSLNLSDMLEIIIKEAKND